MRMKKLIAAGLVSLGCFHSLADESREEVKVIASEPARISYGFQAPGRSSVSCFGAGCGRYYAPVASNGGVAVLRLLRSDASILIVQCKAQGEVPNQSAGAGSGNGNAGQLAPQCMMPDASYQLAADLSPREVTLTMFRPSPDGPGPITTETYVIVGVLTPIPGQQGELSASAAASPATSGDDQLTQQSQIKLDTMPASPASAEHNAGSQTEKPKNRRLRRETAEDLQGSSQLLTYLTHELIDPNRVEAKERLAAMGPVHAALAPETPVSTPLQQEPAGITPPADQGPLAQGPVDAAVTPAAPASTIAVSAPKALAPAPTEAPLAQGPVDTALAPAAAASTITLSEPKALPQAAAKAPLPHGPVDTAIAPAAAAPTIAPQAPKSVSEASMAGNAAPVLAPLPAPPVPAQAASETMPAASVPAQVAAAPEPVAPPAAHAAAAQPPASAPVKATAEPVSAAPVRAKIAAAPEPVAPLVTPVSRRPETAAAQPIAVNSRASSSVPGASSPVPSAPVPPAPSTVPSEQARVAPTAPATTSAKAQVGPSSARTSQGAMQIAVAAPAPPMPRMTNPEGATVTTSADAAFAVSDPLIDNAHLRRLEQKISDLDFPVEELAAQWAMFEKECPEPTTDAMCLDAKTKVIAGTQKVFESKIQLLDQKITSLEDLPQNAIAQREEDEAKDTREKMKVALESFPRVLAHLNKVMEDLKHANEEQ
jgi:hypothetical protein